MHSCCSSLLSCQISLTGRSNNELGWRQWGHCAKICMKTLVSDWCVLVCDRSKSAALPYRSVVFKSVSGFVLVIDIRPVFMSILVDLFKLHSIQFLFSSAINSRIVLPLILTSAWDFTSVLRELSLYENKLILYYLSSSLQSCVVW